jgi:hypothetical protein
MAVKGLTFRFVVQPEKLSLYARFLASSLRRFGPSGIVLQAFVPSHMALDSSTLALFDALDVEVVRFEAELWRKYSYPIGNKIDIAALPAETGHVVVMDSDMIALRPFRIDELTGLDLGMRPIMGPQVFVGENRRQIEDFVSRNVVPAPRSELAGLMAIRTPAQVGFPVFNSGFIVMRSGLGLGERLRELTSLALETEALAPKVRRPFADQLALACLALERAPAVTPLATGWNCHVKAPAARAIIWHYFQFARLIHRPFGRKLVASLQEEFERHDFNLLGERSRREVIPTARRA